MFRQVCVVQKNKRYWRLGEHFFLVAAHLLLDSARVKRPQVGCLFDFVILVQPFLDSINMRKILIYVQSVRRSCADFAVNGHQHEQCGNRSIHFL